MKINLVTPASKRSRTGNWSTAARWGRMLRELGHRVDIDERYDGADADMLIAIHAWRSAESVVRFRDRWPDRPVVVLLAGTDIYRFQHSHPEETYASMAAADRLVALHERAGRDIPARYRGKLDIILQSALPLPRRLPSNRRTFDVCVIGHLRDEKDSLRTAMASRLLPEDSRIRVLHLGKAHDDEWAARARQEMAENPRFVWRGEVPRGAVRRVMAKARVMVLSSRMEGGANVISEAVVADLPVVASRISGSVGLLGADYKGYYPVENEKALAKVLSRCEGDAEFLDTLRRQCRARRKLFRPERERAAWRRLIAEVTRLKK